MREKGGAVEMQIEEVFRKLKTAPWAEDEKAKEEILNELREIGQPVIEKIIEMSGSDWWKTRREACHLLGGLGAIEALWLLEDGRGEELLIQGLKDESEMIRMVAVHSLILIEEVKKTGKAIPSIIDVLKNDESPNIRADAATMLAFIKWDPRVTEALVQALNDGGSTWSKSVFMGTQAEQNVSAFAAQALAKLGDKGGIAALVPRVLEGMWTVGQTVGFFEYVGQPAVEYLIQGLEMESWESRERAAASLGEIGDTQAVEPLIDVLGDEHLKVRITAMEALGKIKDLKALEPLAQALDDEDGSVRRKAIEALKNMGEAALESLIEALKHKDSGVRQDVASALGDIGGARALEALTQAKEDKSWWVRRAANGALKRVQKRVKANH